MSTFFPQAHDHTNSSNSYGPSHEWRIDGAVEQAEQLRAAAAQHADYEAVLAEARHDAARTRRRAHEEGVALIVAARATGLHEREEILAAGAALIEAERTATEAQLRAEADIWALEPAERLLGEPIGASADGARTAD
ncbi:hypothetical protein AB0D12_17455 [Streptomyces sp. NPDC048479]|uniref:F0F1 ATP synthase subunit B family protein n=1 Tax=Streptomyces sp. NPDC048479 TaxID=3154725 RepID=UPI00341D9A5F